MTLLTFTFKYCLKKITHQLDDLLVYMLLFSKKKQLLTFLSHITFVIQPDLFTSDQVVELMQQGIHHYIVNPEFTKVLLNFQLNYPNIFSYTFENKLNYIDYSRCLNSKLNILYDIHSSKITQQVTSNFTPLENSYDLFTQNKDLKICRYQLKNRLSCSLYNIHDINNFINNYNINSYSNNFLVIDLSTLPQIKIDDHLEFFNKNFNTLISDKKIIIHTENLINKNSLKIIESSKYLIKMKF